ncbi:two-component system sensor histidine kinase NtrB [Desulfuribacillus alkaliarsenatis]|uniref:histidine kinase n=1 Tax=Desulfuribacillus alkaliarsenatis TaxID=766136 RepID=A0A1E5G3I5_9FIRM|nr:ATP-binding protein [Desulfuribacillus alkaliarsenatis]OEF97530.1 hypothetical protein BHF68_04810 [Desulfuribacillus alkaliarsenatis]
MVRETGHDGVRKQSEEQLNYELFNNAPIGYVVFDFAGTVRKCNSAFRSLLELNKIDVLGRKLQQWIHPDSQDVFCCYIKQLSSDRLNEEELIQLTLRSKKRDIPVKIRSNLLEYDGEKLIRSMVIDYSEQLKYEQEINRLNQLNTTGKVAAAIAHEVRNPMTTIKGFVQIFQTKPEFLPYKHHLELVDNEINRANDMISEFLSLSRTELPVFTKVNIADEIESILPQITAQAREEDITITTLVKPIPTIHACKQELKQVLINVLKNAIEASSSGDEVKITTINTTFNDCTYATIAVSDQGTGIPEEIQELIGKPFVTTKTNRAGIGLSVVKNIMARHCGKMNFCTSVQGTTFYLHFPVKTKDEIIDYCI